MIEQQTLMMYGSSGSTKTSQLYHLAKYLLEKNPGKHIKMVHASPGGYFPFQKSGMIERKEVKVFPFMGRKELMADFRRLSMGYWPRYTKAGVEVFETRPECLISPAEWDNTIGYFVEDLSSLGEAIKGHCSEQEGNLGFKESFSLDEGGYTFRGINDFRIYNVVQEEITRRLLRFLAFPTKFIAWTALVGKGEDKQNRETVYGPQMIGNAATPWLPSKFMDCLHLSREKWTDNTGEHEGMVAWFMQHEDKQTGVPYLCRARTMPEDYVKLLKQFPHGFVPLGFKNGIDKYFEFTEGLVNNGKGE